MFKKQQQQKHHLIKIAEAKSFHSRAALLWSMDAREMPLPTNKKKLWVQSLKVREATTASNWLQPPCLQGRTYQRTWTKAGLQPWASSGHRCCGSTAVSGWGEPRDHHHHMQKGCRYGNMKVKNQLGLGSYGVGNPACPCFLAKGLTGMCRGIFNMCGDPSFRRAENSLFIASFHSLVFISVHH